MLPNFLIIGAQKAGTTSLLRYLSTHRDIFVLNDKEISCFFDDPAYNSRFLDYPYENYFKGWSGEQLVGNAPVNTLYFAAETARNIYNKQPNMKLVAILRNPIDRAYSAYLYFVNQGVETRTFEDALKGEACILREGSFREHCNFTYVSHGFYYEQLQRFVEYFDRNQLLVLLFDEFKVSPKNTLRKLFAFLGVEPSLDEEIYSKRYNVFSRPFIPVLNKLVYEENNIKSLYKLIIPYKWRVKMRYNVVFPIIAKTSVRSIKPPMRGTTRSILRDLYLEHNSKLEKLLNCDVSQWNTIE